MAGDVEDLVLSVSADVTQIRRALKRLEGDTARSTRRVQRSFDRMGDRVGRTFSVLSRSMIGAFAGVASARGFQQLVDGATRVENALKVAGLSGEELTRVYDRLYASAQRNAAPIESLVQLYSRAAIVQNELNVSTEELLRFTDNVALALRVAGTDAQSASGALLQLSQALGSGIVRAEEFNSMLEGALPIVQAAAAGLDEAGGSVARLRQLVVDGEVSSEAFFRAFEAGSVILEEKVAGAELTVSQQFVRLQNVLQDTAGKFDDTVGVSDALGGALEELSGIIEALGDVMVDIADSDIAYFIEQLARPIRLIDEFKEKIGGLRNLPAFLGAVHGVVQDRVRGITPEQRRAEDRIEQAFAPGETTEKTDRLPRLEVEVTEPAPSTVSLADYPIGGGAGGGSGGSSRRGGGGGSSAARRADDYERLTKRINEATFAMQAETAAMAGINPLVDDYGFAVERARIEHDLLTAAQEAGREVTPQLRAEIAALAEQYALATVEAEKLAERHHDIRRAAEDVAEFNKDLARGIVDGFMRGKDAADIFADALSKVADRLLDIAMNSIFDNMGGGFLGGILGGFGGGGQLAIARGGGIGLYDSGGYTGGGGKYEPKGIVHGGEYVFSKEAVQRAGVGNLEAMHRSLKGYAEGGLVAPTIPMHRSATRGPQRLNITVNVEGANGDQHVIDLVRQGVDQGIARYDSTQAPQTAVRSVQQYQQRSG